MALSLQSLLRNLKDCSAQSVNGGHLIHAVNEKASVRDFEGRQGDQKCWWSKPPLPRRAGGRLHIGNCLIKLLEEVSVALLERRQQKGVKKQIVEN